MDSTHSAVILPFVSTAIFAARITDLGQYGQVGVTKTCIFASLSAFLRSILSSSDNPVRPPETMHKISIRLVASCPSGAPLKIILYPFFNPTEILGEVEIPFAFASAESTDFSSTSTFASISDNSFKNFLVKSTSCFSCSLTSPAL
ncbi:MAG: hypothetical protein BWY84_00874 [Candidatus Aerophobetes bacterium ADurb.Bin490]|nr:MAG: hypothetical protein BWY84_00874 [Candidatus Aerophobetes bacterium ADurb.Bin490]